MIRRPAGQPVEAHMSDTIDLTLWSGSLPGLEREMRLLRAQYDQLSGTVAARLNGIDASLGSATPGLE